MTEEGRTFVEGLRYICRIFAYISRIRAYICQRIDVHLPNKYLSMFAEYRRKSYIWPLQSTRAQFHRGACDRHHHATAVRAVVVRWSDHCFDHLRNPLFCYKSLCVAVALIAIKSLCFLCFVQVGGCAPATRPVLLVLLPSGRGHTSIIWPEAQKTAQSDLVILVSSGRKHRRQRLEIPAAASNPAG